MRAVRLPSSPAPSLASPQRNRMYRRSGTDILAGSSAFGKYVLPYIEHTELHDSVAAEVSTIDHIAHSGAAGSPQPGPPSRRRVRLPSAGSSSVATAPGSPGLGATGSTSTLDPGIGPSIRRRRPSVLRLDDDGPVQGALSVSWHTADGPHGGPNSGLLDGSAARLPEDAPLTEARKRVASGRPLELLEEFDRFDQSVKKQMTMAATNDPSLFCPLQDVDYAKKIAEILAAMRSADTVVENGAPPPPPRFREIALSADGQRLASSTMQWLALRWIGGGDRAGSADRGARAAQRELELDLHLCTLRILLRLQRVAMTPKHGKMPLTEGTAWPLYLARIQSDRKQAQETAECVVFLMKRLVDDVLVRAMPASAGFVDWAHREVDALFRNENFVGERRGKGLEKLGSKKMHSPALMRYVRAYLR